jgi:hypothetical protein
MARETRLADVSLSPTGENRYSGTAKDSDGLEYDLTLEVLGNNVTWTAEARDKKLSTHQLEQKLVKHLGLTDISLEQKAADRFEGSGISANGEKHQFTMVVTGNKYSVESKYPLGKTRSVEATINVGGSNQSGSFTP